jgi:pseudaminic acid biosynthesis-associated methylase
MSEQQEFWSNTYAAEYISKNDSFDAALGNEAWSQMLFKADPIESVLECGSNIGRNVSFLQSLLPNSLISVIEISKLAFEFVNANFQLDESFHGPITESRFNKTFDLVFSMGVLIHIHPDDLLANMRRMYEHSSKYILIGEYFSRRPEMIEYQGSQEKLFKCDFGKIFSENFEVKLVDYGFLWGHIYDKAGFDDITWHLFQK